MHSVFQILESHGRTGKWHYIFLLTLKEGKASEFVLLEKKFFPSVSPRRDQFIPQRVTHQFQNEPMFSPSWILIGLKGLMDVIGMISMRSGVLGFTWKPLFSKLCLQVHIMRVLGT